MKRAGARSSAPSRESSSDARDAKDAKGEADTTGPRASNAPNASKSAASPPRNRRSLPVKKRGPTSANQKSPRAKPTTKVHLLRRPAFWVAASMGVTIAAVVAILLVGYGRLSGPERPAAVEIDWPANANPDQAASILTTAGLVRSEGAMAMFLRASGGTGDFIPGPHLLPSGATPWELRRMLSRAPDRPTTRVTIPEGFHRFDIAARLEKLHVAGRRAFLAASADPALLDKLGIERGGAVGAESAEGYLFPATYDLPKDSDAREVVTRLVKEGDRRWEALVASRKDGFEALRSSLGWGRREVLTLASLVEKEAAVDEERPLIASVFLNRLLDPSFNPKRLQSDPTSAYGCVAWPDEAPSCAGFTGRVTPAMNQDAKNRYSTYVRPGLPPGPIANPGARSIEAVLAPAATKYLYFVATGAGRHTFSETLEAHNEAIRKPR